ncbi:MAG TPA: carbohydrate ABC transporter permease [Thermomicrobiales bacterium]|jgi:multiple sugar transport system permease protein/raffinose/stachyose/melibiose transport system permease protein
MDVATQPDAWSASHRSKSALHRFLVSGDWWRYILLSTVSVFLFAPFFVTLIISVKDLNQFNVAPFRPTAPFHWENYREAGHVVVPYIFNSIVVSGAACFGVVFVGSLTAYVFARFSFPGKELLYYAILLLLMIPGILTLVPSFVVVRDLHLLNTRWALILPWIAGGQVFAIFILRIFYQSMPRELFEAARIDGAGELGIYWRIAVPLSQSILGVVAIFNILATWNDFLWPLITISTDDRYPLVLGLYRFRSFYYTAWGPLMAGYVIGTIPLIILFAFTSKLFVEGLQAGGIKL